MNSPVIFVVYLRREEVNSFLSSLSDPAYSLLCNHRIRLFLYIVDPSHKYYTQFPINILRNIGIMHVRTSHFAVLDVDMWLSGRKLTYHYLSFIMRYALLICRPKLWNCFKNTSRSYRRSQNGHHHSCLLSHGVEDCQWDVRGASWIVDTCRYSWLSLEFVIEFRSLSRS